MDELHNLGESKTLLSGIYHKKCNEIAYYLSRHPRCSDEGQPVVLDEYRLPRVVESLVRKIETTIETCQVEDPQLQDIKDIASCDEVYMVILSYLKEGKTAKDQKKLPTKSPVNNFLHVWD